MKTNLSKQKKLPHSADQIKSVALRVGLLAALCAMPLNSALASFSNVECRDHAVTASVSGNTDISGNTFNNSAALSVSYNNLSNPNGDQNVAAAVLEFEPNVGYGVGVVSVSNGLNATMKAYTSGNGGWAAGFWSDQIYGSPAVQELNVDNLGTMYGEAQVFGYDQAFGAHSFNLYGGANITNESGATMSAKSTYYSTGCDVWGTYGAINFVNNGTITGYVSGIDPGDPHAIGAWLQTYDNNSAAPIYCENNGWIEATAAGGTNNYVYAAQVWAQGGNLTFINRGTYKATSWGGSSGNAEGVYCGSNNGDDNVVNSGQITAGGSPGWALGIENDSGGVITVNNSGLISQSATSGQGQDGIYGGMGLLLWVNSGPAYVTNTGTIYGGTFGIDAGVYGGPITIYDSGDITGGSKAMNLGAATTPCILPDCQRFKA